MIEEIKEDNNCIVKAFENNPIAILQDDIENKKVYYFKASDVGKVLGIVNIHSTIQNYEDEDERVIRKAYDPQKNLQNTTFLSSQGVYRLLYNSKKEIAKKFRKWAGNILDDIIFNESIELKRQLEEKDKIIQQLENKPETYGFDREAGYIYLINDTDKNGHYKIGLAIRPEGRVSNLNTASSTNSLKIISRFDTFNTEFSEKIIHLALKPFRIKNRKEWFYFKDDLELAYTINTIKKCIVYVNNFDIKDYNNFKEINKSLDVQTELKCLLDETLLQEHIKQEINDKIKLQAQQFTNKTGNYKGVHWNDEKNKWRTELKKDYKNIFLGYYDTELDGAKVYNEYALFLNQTKNTNYLLNEIEGFEAQPRNVPKEYKEIILENKSSIYIGVKYIKTRNNYESYIMYKNKRMFLGTRDNELDAAKLYNQQAMYYNENHNTKYILNNILGFITTPKNIMDEKPEKNKSSQYYGVIYSNQKNKFRALLVFNKKQLNLGFFENELDAAKAYNVKANELNTQLNKIAYKINQL